MADPSPSSGGPAHRSSARLDVEVVRQAELWHGIHVSDATMEQAARAAFVAAPPPKPGPYEVTLVLADDGEMRNLNRIWRGKDAPTNVLSFPAGTAVGEPSRDSCPLGDVVLAAETVSQEAGQQGIAVADHASHLIVHGVLHLLGFDHERDQDAERMEALETKVLAGLGIADPYAEPGRADVAEVSP